MTLPAGAAARHPHDPAPSPAAEEYHDDIIYPDTLAFLSAHLACVGVLWSGVTALSVWICIALYVVRMFGVTAGYHRYFSHRSFKTSRAFQFVLALLAQSSAQKSVMWWAAKHRHHHRHSDTEEDVHSPRHRGFLYAHVGWIFARKHRESDADAVPDLAKYPELRWLTRWENAPAVALAVACFVVAGWPGLFMGFFVSTVLVYHGTFCINSLAHVHGRQRYVTGDDSRNNWWLAVITLGEGWHNNHHAYQRSTRQGFRWWEFDPTFYALALLSWVRVVWELGEPPADVVRNERRLGRAVVEKVARQLAASFPAERISAQVREAWSHHPTFADLAERARSARAQAEAAVAELSLPHLPSADEIRRRAHEMFAHSPSTDEIVARAREIVAHAVAARLVSEAVAAPA